MRNHRYSRIVLPAIALLGLATACSDAPATAPADVRPSLASSSANSYVESQTMVGDTTVTVFVVGTNSSNGPTFDIGNTSRIYFPYAAASICDPALSSYGPGTWDDKCTVLKSSIQITAKSWVDKKTKRVATDFQPALRFVPNLKKSVTLSLKDAALAGTRIDFCTPSGCIDESIADPSLVTYLDPNNGFAYRTIKHFSGYTVTAD